LQLYVETRQTMYVWRNIEERSCNHCCSGKAANITYFKCVFVALGILHVKRVRFVHCNLWPVSSIIFFHIISYTAGFSKKLLKIKCFVFSTTFVWNISHSTKNWVRHHKCILVSMERIRHSCQVLMKLEFSRQIFQKILIHEISWKSVQWKPICSVRRDEANRRFPQFWESA